MITQITTDKSLKLFVYLAGFFIMNAIVAEFIGVKIFSFETTLGIKPLQFHLLSQTLDLNLTAGVLIWPVVFIMTDIINEYYGPRGVRMLSYLTAALIAVAFLIVYLAMQLSPATFFINSKQGSGIADMNNAFKQIFGQGIKIISGSIIAFIIGQIVDAAVFQKIKNRTGENKIWLRATASTVVSQLIDSYVVLFIAFYIGSRVNANEGDFIWSFSLVMAVGTVNFLYKILCAILLIPLLYFVHTLIEKYLGKALATEMKSAALKISNKQ